jgi:hypothetical protein
MHYAHFRSAAETAAELGHGASLRMMQRQLFESGNAGGGASILADYSALAA